MKEILKRGIAGFGNSAVCGLIVNLIIELAVRHFTGDSEFIPLSPEFVQMFASETVAMEVNILLYGGIGAAFAMAAWIFEQDRLGFVLQNLIYFVMTSVVWVPVVTLIWQLWRRPEALYGTLAGFFCTYIIMSYVGYRITRRDVTEINQALKKGNATAG